MRPSLRPDYVVMTQAGATPGIRIKATLDPGDGHDFDGTFGIVQTLTSMIYAADQSGQLYRGMAVRNDGTGKDYSMLPSPTYSDFLPGKGADYPYYPFQRADNTYLTTPATVGVTQSAYLTDSPDSRAYSGYGMSRKDQFVDTLVYTPSGGIAVSLGNYQWSWEFKAQFPTDGSRAAGQFVAPHETQSYKKSTSDQIPSWEEDVVNFNSNSSWRAVPGKVADATVPDTVPYDNLAQAPRTGPPPTFGFNTYNGLTPEQQVQWLIALGELPQGTTVADLPNLDNGTLPTTKLASGHTDPLTGSWIPDAPAPTKPPLRLVLAPPSNDDLSDF